MTIFHVTYSTPDKQGQWHPVMADVLCCPLKPKLPTTTVTPVYTSIQHVTVWQGLVSPTVIWQEKLFYCILYIQPRWWDCVSECVYFPGLTHSSFVCQDQVCVDFLLLLLHFQAKYHLGLPAHRRGRPSITQILLHEAKVQIFYCKCVWAFTHPYWVNNVVLWIPHN